MSLFIFLISSIIILISSIISKKSFFDQEKISPFECGFDPFNFSRIPFSIRFFLIALIFLIFDVEIALILPIILILKFRRILSWITRRIFLINSFNWSFSWMMPRSPKLNFLKLINIIIYDKLFYLLPFIFSLFS